jgi:hypothetical protein
MMNLEIDRCYRVELMDGSEVRFRFLDYDANGIVWGELPIGSGKRENISQQLERGCGDYEEIDSP